MIREMLRDVRSLGMTVHDEYFRVSVTLSDAKHQIWEFLVRDIPPLRIAVISARIKS